MEFQRVQKKPTFVDARPIFPGEEVPGMSISETDVLAYERDGGWCMRNPDNHDDKWFVNMEFFVKHYDVPGDD